MTAPLIAALTVVMLGTAFLSGIFGMAGGLILMGVLLALLPLPEAMALHAVTQISSNAWRGLLWVRHVQWRAAGGFLAGSAIAFLAWTVWLYVPSKPIAFILLGISPFLVRLVPAGIKPDPERLRDGIIYGAGSMTLTLLAGVSGPLVDSFFLSGTMDRKQIVATKAACQMLSHSAKLLYFGGLVDQASNVNPWMATLAIAASIVGTSAARPVLERLSDAQYRTWANHIITVIACAYLAQGGYMLLN